MHQTKVTTSQAYGWALVWVWTAACGADIGYEAAPPQSDERVALAESERDEDADGFAADVDCDDHDPYTYPNAVEDCGPLDRDCDGDPQLGAVDVQVWYLDADRDGVGTGEGTVSCRPGPDYALVDGDCDDSRQTGHLCSQDCTTFYLDADRDGFGNDAHTQLRCAPLAGWTEQSGDCTDANPYCNSDCTDADGDGYCAGFDCDEDASTGSTCASSCAVFYRDADGDGVGVESETVTACSAPAGYAEVFGDCDDSPTTGAGCSEGCNAYYEDADADGYGDPDRAVFACANPGGYVTNATDCAPDKSECHTDCGDPDGDGVCTDADCDETTSNAAVCSSGCTTFYRDEDGDGYGDSGRPARSCSLPLGYVSDKTDCYDLNENANPEQTQGFGVDRGDGSFDYNCDKDEDFSSSLDKSSQCSGTSAKCILLAAGWETDAGFACGKEMGWIYGCTSACEDKIELRPVECR